MGAPKQSVHNGLGAGQDTAGQGNESTQRGFLGEVALEMAELEWQAFMAGEQERGDHNGKDIWGPLQAFLEQNMKEGSF